MEYTLKIEYCYEIANRFYQNSYLNVSTGTYDIWKIVPFIIEIDSSKAIRK